MCVCLSLAQPVTRMMCVCVLGGGGAAGVQSAVPTVGGQCGFVYPFLTLRFHIMKMHTRQPCVCVGAAAGQAAFAPWLGSQAARPSQ
jgi:hypothetical protein